MNSFALALRVFLHFQGCLWAYWLRLVRRAPRYYYSGKSLLRTATSFQFSDDHHKDAWLVLRVYKYVIHLLLRQRPVFKQMQGAPDLAVYDVGLDHAHRRASYLEETTGERPALVFAASDQICSDGFLHGLMVFGLVSAVVGPAFLLSLLYRAPVPYALWLIILTRLYTVLHLLKKNGIRRLHYFCIYEAEANCLALLLMRAGIHVTKCPSEAPLSFSNKIVVADALAICFAYQEEERQRYAATHFVETFPRWVPEQTFTFLHHYLGKTIAPPPGTLGYYPSGAWKRKERGDVDRGFGYYQSEERLMKALGRYVRARPAVQLRIFLHPIEKQTEADYERARSFYQEKLETCAFELMDRARSTAASFDEADVAVSVYSTVCYERIFAGFKMVFAPFYIHEFPLPGTRLEAVSARDEASLFDLLDRVLAMPTQAYFEVFGLAGYTYRNHPQIVKRLVNR